jgi:hypothetical protein
MHPLERTIRAISRRARGLQIVYALSVAVSIVVVVATALGIVDFISQLEDRSVRMMATAALIAAATWAFARLLLPALRYRPSMVEIARHVEERYPRIEDRLSSAVQFLFESANDPRSSSAVLRKAVIAQTESEIQSVNWAAVYDSRPTRRALAIAAGIVAVALLIVVCAPQSARVAMIRLLNPLSQQTWPHVVEERLAVREAAIATELRRIVSSERNVFGQTSALQEQLSQAGALRKQDLDQLQTVKLNQLQVRHALAGGGEGTAAQIAALLAEIDSNRIETPKLVLPMRQLAEEIEKLNRNALAETERQLTIAVTTTQTVVAGKSTVTDDAPQPESTQIRMAVDLACQRQQEVIKSLEAALDKLDD